MMVGVGEPPTLQGREASIPFSISTRLFCKIVRVSNRQSPGNVYLNGQRNYKCYNSYRGVGHFAVHSDGMP